MKRYDCVVIGGGPAGMTAALYLLRAGVNMAWVEKLSPGGQTLLTETIDNYPGYPKGIKGYELADLFAAHLQEHTFDKYMDEVQIFDPEPGNHRIKVGDEWLEARTVIVATGSEYRKLGVEREQELTGRGVSYCALCDGNFYRDKVVAVVGGGNSALEEALYLTKIVKKLYLIHRRKEFRGMMCYQDKCFADPKITMVLESTVDAILGDNEVEGLRVRNVQTDETREIEVDGLFVFVGFKPQATFLPAELNMDEAGYVITDTEMHTNIEGVYAAGDARSKLCRQVVTAVGDGATAAHAASVYLDKL
ncbi:MAG: thioredoxin-disulfide reductase [Oceanidesulfovibrio sp.]